MEIKYTGMELKLHRHGIQTTLASVFGAMLIATPLVGDSALANGIVMGKVFWFHLSMALMAIGTVVTAWLGGRKSIPFALPDGLLLLFAGITLATYDWQLDPEPEKLLFGGQLVVLWFLLRYFLTEAPCLKFFFLFVLMLTGLVEAVWGMQQLHGYAYSNHSLFRLTGSFFNPGPYCGYLAVVLPVCLWTALRFQKGMHYFGWVCAGAILIVLPAGMSRSAWMAAVVACGWVYWTERIGWEKTKAVCRRYKNATIPFIAIVAILVGCTIAGVYGMKQDSADGRLLMWKVTGFLTEAPCLKFFFLFVLMLTGLVEAVWGMQQLHGYAYSNHSLFRLTGSFFNPGPYCGYLAVVLPVCLWTALRFQKGMHYFGWVCAGAILIVLPAGMSRSAWMAAVVACGWVYWTERIGWEKTKAVCRRYKNATIPFIAIVAILVGCTIAGVYGMKQDSADGRLLMWKVTGKAIAGQPLAGTGLGGFPAAYAEAQGGYFATGNATDREKRVAGCPEYAFNEYLQIGLEQGVGGLIVFVAWLGNMAYYGIRNRQQGAAGGVLAFAVFAVSSYPLQLPSFWVALVFLGAICVTEDGTRTRSSALSVSPVCHITMISLLSLASVCLFILQKGQYEAYKRWGRMQMIYNNKAYESVAEDYHELHDKLKHKPEFLFEEAQCLSKTGQHAEAIRVLERAKRLSGDPMIRYMIAKNQQMLGDYREAEEELLQAIGILPERLYPYYLLAKLYAEPEFYQVDKLRAAASVVLAKKPKVETTAIREMREEVKKIIDKGDFD